MRSKKLIIILFLAFAGCVIAPPNMAEKESTFAPVEASLTNIDQKVASHFLVTGVPEGFDETQYKKAVKEVCYLSPSCKSQAETIFNSYIVRARKIDEMFSVMLCYKDTRWKIMEHFSCDNMRVQVRSWKTQNNVPCDFETDWVHIKQENCSN